MWPFTKKTGDQLVEDDAERRLAAVEQPPVSLAGWDEDDREDTQIIVRSLVHYREATTQGIEWVRHTTHALRDVAQPYCPRHVPVVA